MQHLKEVLNFKKKDFSELLTTYCEITEKIDGNALQVYNNGVKLIYGKRGENPYKPVNNLITDIDLATNYLYYKIYMYLNQYKNILKQYKILNFEIFSSDEHYNNHIIPYNNQYKNDIVLLSGLSLDDKILSETELNVISTILNISYNPIIWSGKFSDDIINNLKKYKDDDINLWNYICETFKIDKNVINGEGIVLSFKDKKLKVQNPNFQVLLKKHLYEEQKSKDINLEKYYDLIIDNVLINYDKVKIHKDSSVLIKLLDLYLYIIDVEKNLDEVEKTLKNIEILKNTEINTLLIKQFYDGFSDDIKYPCLLNFILFGFRAKRKRFPLWCSKDYQNNKLNIFLDKILS